VSLTLLRTAENLHNPKDKKRAMKNLFFLCLFLFSLLSLRGQISAEQITISEFLKLYPDSGGYANGVTIILKEGQWVEHYIDSSMTRTKVNIGNTTNSFMLGLHFEKKVGSYIDNKKEGIWTEYYSSGYENKITWERRSTINYKNGLKDGEEIMYQGYGEYQTPSIVRRFKDGIENGNGMVYDLNYPYLLSYSYFVSNGILDGSFINYHTNGQRWNEIIYKEGKAMEVLFNYDRAGKPQNKGTLKNGNGTIIRYDEEGKEIEVMNFSNGIQIN
jgi:antitoxin component YwqK of YwqJK toxin-antitoxin module